MDARLFSTGGPFDGELVELSETGGSAGVKGCGKTAEFSLGTWRGHYETKGIRDLIWKAAA